jgi:uncharacterized membrane protein YhhN
VFAPATVLSILAAAAALTKGAHDEWAAPFFMFALAASTAGDVLLMLHRDRFFLAGLVVFLLAHLAYIAGLNPALPPGDSIVLVPVIGAIVYWLNGRIARGMRRRSQSRLRVPVAIYSLVISVMLFSAWATLFRSDWNQLRRLLVISGATLFFASDAMLAWDRFVSPSPTARIRIITTYHLAQAALAASLALFNWPGIAT